MGEPAHFRYYMGRHNGALGPQVPEIRKEAVGRERRQRRVESMCTFGSSFDTGELGRLQR